MKRLSSRIIAASCFLFATPTFACELFFNLEGEDKKYPYQSLPQFVREKVRMAVKDTEDELDRYKIAVNYTCAEKTTQAYTAKFTVQKNTIYIKAVNDIPLCKESPTPKGLRCDKEHYDFVGYKGGADITIDENAAVAALRAISSVVSVADLESAFEDSERRKEIHDAIRLFAFILAESARFDYVLDDIACSIETGKPVKFMDYWGLMHNWLTISTKVANDNPALKPATARNGAGSLFVPVTQKMVDFFNAELIRNPPNPEDTSASGKNLPIPPRKFTCEMQSQPSTATITR